MPCAKPFRHPCFGCGPLFTRAVDCSVSLVDPALACRTAEDLHRSVTWLRRPLQAGALPSRSTATSSAQGRDREILCMASCRRNQPRVSYDLKVGPPDLIAEALASNRLDRISGPRACLRTNLFSTGRQLPTTHRPDADNQTAHLFLNESRKCFVNYHAGRPNHRGPSSEQAGLVPSPL